MSDEEILEAAKRFCGHYICLDSAGAKDEVMNFYIEQAYILAITMEGDLLIIDQYTTEGSKAVFDEYNRKSEEKSYSYRYPDQSFHYETRILRMEDENTLLYENPVYGRQTTFILTESGNLKRFATHSDAYERVE
ncbi:MAG: hypothetical protein IJI46_10345 [Erysipelotrichaceae bacterium]|nr:hypothetical protein [Erysipelotrichaceae bacterium]